MTWAIVPVKPLAQAKSRLSPRLGARQRGRLVLRLLGEVLDALGATPELCGRVVVTADTRVAAFARRRGAEVLREATACGLNVALLRAAGWLQVRGVRRALIVPADLALARAPDFRRLLACADADARVVVPARDGRGTGALLTPLPFVPCFGPDSFRRHCAPLPGTRVVVHRCPRIAFDIDLPADLDCQPRAEPTHG